MKLTRSLWIALAVLLGFLVARYIYWTYRAHQATPHSGSSLLGDSGSTVTS